MPHRIPQERVAHETVDGEVVILDQASGLYFSLTGAGADVWELLGSGVAAADLAAALVARYDIDAAGAEAAAAALVDELTRAGLIEPADRAAQPVSPGNGSRRPWAPPLLERFEELQTLLLLDPIHDVDESGWPRTPPERS